MLLLFQECGTSTFELLHDPRPTVLQYAVIAVIVAFTIFISIVFDIIPIIVVIICQNKRCNRYCPSKKCELQAGQLRKDSNPQSPYFITRNKMPFITTGTGGTKPSKKDPKLHYKWSVE